MEKPDFPLPSGRYVVTGERDENDDTRHDTETIAEGQTSIRWKRDHDIADSGDGGTMVAGRRGHAARCHAPAVPLSEVRLHVPKLEMGSFSSC